MSFLYQIQIINSGLIILNFAIKVFRLIIKDFLLNRFIFVLPRFRDIQELLTKVKFFNYRQYRWVFTRLDRVFKLATI